MKKLIILLILACMPAICLASSIVSAPTLGGGVNIIQTDMKWTTYTAYGSYADSGGYSYPSFYATLQLPINKQCEWDMNFERAGYNYNGTDVSLMMVGAGFRYEFK